MEMEAENICHICLNACRKLFSIFSAKNGRYLPNVIYNISGVKVRRRERPNAKICKDCADEVINAESVILRCQEAEEIFTYNQRELRIGSNDASIKSIDIFDNNAVSEGQDDLETYISDDILQGALENVKEVAIRKWEEENCAMEKCNQNVAAYESPLHECQHCTYRTRSRLCLVDHHREKHGLDENSMYKCSMCAKTFSWRRTLFMHMEKEHKILPTEKKFLCEECGKAYFRKRFLLDHIKQQHAQKYLQCPQADCNKVFNRKFTLRRHFESMHTNVKRHYCEQCDMHFSCLDKWRYHVQSVHQRKHCPHCGLWFRKQRILDVHIQSKKCLKCIYKCPYCPRRFTAERGVKVHLDNACKYKAQSEEDLSELQ